MTGSNRTTPASWRIWSASLGILFSLSLAQAFSPVGVFSRNIVRDTVSIKATTVSQENLQTSANDCITRPKGATNDWEVHKFGGASLANADLYRTVGDLLIEEAAGRGSGGVPTMAVVSARGGMTDLLVNVVDAAVVDFEEAKANLKKAAESQIELLQEIAPEEITAPIVARIRQDEQDILSVVQSLKMINTVPAVTMEVVTGFGEIWSAQTLFAYLQTKEVPCAWIDARDILVVKSDSSGLGEKGAASTGGVVPLWEETSSRMSNWWNTIGRENGFLDIDYSVESPIVVVTGFVAITADGVPTTLKRSGSDYSATILAKLTKAGRVTMWKNTNGVYTADPRRVPEAFPIASLKYDEAMELAYFGAQVLHPSAMVPCIDDEIPVYVRNIFNPSFEGTVIQGRCPLLKDLMNGEEDLGPKVKSWQSKKDEIPIKGITSVDKIALVTLEGASVIGGANVAERFMGAMADNGINVLIITQASSESSICIAVPENQGELALETLKQSFELELARSTVNSVSMASGMAIVAIVGEGMAMKSGVSATFMSSLAKANVNLRLIAQGSSERQIAVVVDGNDTSRALRAAHMAFTLSETAVSLTVLGCSGQVGSAFLQQLNSQQQMLKDDLDVDMRVTIAACSTKAAFGKNSEGLELDRMSELLVDEELSKDFDLDGITEAMAADVNPHRVIIDCTNSARVGDYYERWASAGINIISPNRKVAAGPIDYYASVRQKQRDNNVNWQFESSVGSALPILSTLRDLQETGDNIKVISGCVSGTMAYVLSSFGHTVPFCKALEQAEENDFTETDLREDLSGLDTARKVVILARQAGLDVELKDVKIESLVPEEVANKDYSHLPRAERNLAIIEDLKPIEGKMYERLKAAEKNDRVLRYKFRIDLETGDLECGIMEVDRIDPLFRLKANENLVATATTRYTSSPLIVKGAAAGPNLAAAGVFADLLRLTRGFTTN